MKEYPVQIDGKPVLLRFREATFDEVAIASARISNRRDEIARMDVRLKQLREDEAAGKPVDSRVRVSLADSYVEMSVEMFAEIRKVAAMISDPTGIPDRMKAFTPDSTEQMAILETCIKFLMDCQMEGERGKN